MAYPQRLDTYRAQVEAALQVAIDRCLGPTDLLAAMRYSLLAGGKRLRPVLLLATRDVFLPGGEDPMPAACALEFIHTYSLVHDDLPAMDNDDFRRGRPSSHKKFGEATAILVGDALLTQAFWLLGDAYGRATLPGGLRVIAEIADAAGSGGMVGGQYLDTVETGRVMSQKAVEEVHRLKTGALIRTAVRCGALLGAADEDDLAALTRYAERLGLAFQVADDVLDVTSTQETLGKSIGKDQAQGKTTFVTLLGVDGCHDYTQQLLNDALQELQRFGDKAEMLRVLAEFIVGRTS